MRRLDSSLNCLGLILEERVRTLMRCNCISILELVYGFLEVDYAALKVLLIIHSLKRDEVGEKHVAKLVLLVRVSEEEVHIELLIFFL